MINQTNITGIILAGGKSSRMGTDKGFMILNDLSFMSRIIKVIKPLVSDLIIVSNDKKYDVFNLKRIDDMIENSGPLAGLYSGLYHSKTKYNLVLSCDVPLINSAVIKILLDECDDQFDVIQLESNGETIPLVALYKKDCMHLIFELLQNNEKRLRYAVEQFKTKTISVNNELREYVRNINTPEQLREIQNENYD